MLRSVLSVFPKKEGTYPFFVFMDTNSRISNFSPSNQKDPSSRVALSGFKLFDPFYTLSHIDLFKNECNSLEDVADVKRLFQLGRPFVSF
jgi:hypothetical protein